MTAATVDSAFGEVAALAAQERRIHPDPQHFREVDGALEALRVAVRTHLALAGEARSIGNSPEAEQHVARAAIVVRDARFVWEARLASAEVAAGRESRRLDACSIARSTAIRAGGVIGRPSRDAALDDACRTLCQRVELIACELGAGDDTAFEGRLGDLDNALKSATNSLTAARRELRIRQAATRADAAVASRLAAAA